MVRWSALWRNVAIAALLVSVAVRGGAAADVAGAPSAGAPPSTVPAVPATSTDAITFKEDGARWEDAYGEKFYQVVGVLTNVGKSPVGAVRVRVELLDESGKVVASFEGWNARAEALGDLDAEAARAELAELTPGPIAPGESDRFRSTFLADETPKFASHRVRVLTVLPPA